MFAEGLLAADRLVNSHVSQMMFCPLEQQGRIREDVFILRLPEQNSHLPSEHDASIRHKEFFFFLLITCLHGDPLWSKLI